MRMLSSYELDLIAGGVMSGSTDGSGGGGTGDPGTGGTRGSITNVAVPEIQGIIAPTALGLASFFDALSTTVADTPQHDTQNSDPEGNANYSPLDGTFLEMFGWMPAVQAMPEAHYWDFLTAGIDQEFLLESSDIASFSGTFTSGSYNIVGSATVNSFDSTHAAFTVDGITSFGTWHPGATTSSNSGSGTGTLEDPIIIHGNSGDSSGYWTFTTTPTFALPPAYTGPGSSSSTPAAPAGPSYPAGWDTAYDHNVDTHAAHLAQLINGKPDSEFREYSAFIYKDANGVLHESSVLMGKQTTTGNPNGPSYTFGDYGVPADATIVAFIHNHPEYYPETTNGLLTYSLNGNAQYIDNGDISGMITLAKLTDSAGNPYADVQNGINYFRDYIVHGTTVNEYDYVNNPTVPPPPPGTPASWTVYPLPGAVKGTYNP